MPSPAPRQPGIRTAAEICRGYHIESADLALLRDSMTPREFLQSLTAAGRIAGAIQFVAQVLPKREAVPLGLPVSGEKPRRGGFTWGSSCPEVRTILGRSAGAVALL